MCCVADACKAFPRCREKVWQGRVSVFYAHISRKYASRQNAQRTTADREILTFFMPDALELTRRQLPCRTAASGSAPCPPRLNRYALTVFSIGCNVKKRLKRILLQNTLMIFCG